MKQSRVLRFIPPVQRRRPVRMTVSVHLASRVHYPAFVTVVDQDAVSSHASTHAFDALYRNAMAFMEKVSQEEIFQ